MIIQIHSSNRSWLNLLRLSRTSWIPLAKKVSMRILLPRRLRLRMYWIVRAVPCFKGRSIPSMILMITMSHLNRMISSSLNCPKNKKVRKSLEGKRRIWHYFCPVVEKMTWAWEKLHLKCWEQAWPSIINSSLFTSPEPWTVLRREREVTI